MLRPEAGCPLCRPAALPPLSSCGASLAPLSSALTTLRPGQALNGFLGGEGRGRQIHLVPAWDEVFLCGLSCQPIRLETNVPISRAIRLSRAGPSATGLPAWGDGKGKQARGFLRVYSNVPGEAYLHFIQRNWAQRPWGLLGREASRGWIWTQTPFCLGPRSCCSAGGPVSLPPLRTPSLRRRLPPTALPGRRWAQPASLKGHC